MWRPFFVHFSAGRPKRGRFSRRAAVSNQLLNEWRAEGGDGRLDDEWKHQQLVDIERESDGGDNADQPLGG